MMDFGAFGLIGFLLFAVLVMVPFWRLLPQFGVPAWISVFSLVPLGAIILLWVMAFRDRILFEPDA